MACAAVLAPSWALADGPADAARAGSGVTFNGLGLLRERASSVLAPAQHNVVLASQATASDPAPRTPPQVVQAYACLIGGTTSMAVAFAAGAENLVNTIAGGVVPTHNQGVLILGVAGIVFASFCALGQALTPVYLYYTEPLPTERAADTRRGPQIRPAAHAAAATRVNLHAGVLGGTASAAARRIDNAIDDRPIGSELAQVPTSSER